MKLLFTPEDLERMSDEEVDAKINEVFRNDDYEWGRANNVEWETFGRICERLDDICYKCPRCGAENPCRNAGAMIQLPKKTLCGASFFRACPSVNCRHILPFSSRNIYNTTELCTVCIDFLFILCLNIHSNVYRAAIYLKGEFP